MSFVARPQDEVKKWCVIVFVIVGGLLTLLAFDVLPAVTGVYRLYIP